MQVWILKKTIRKYRRKQNIKLRNYKKYEGKTETVRKWKNKWETAYHKRRNVNERKK